jgi:hypothetical protein
METTHVTGNEVAYGTFDLLGPALQQIADPPAPVNRPKQASPPFIQTVKAATNVTPKRPIDPDAEEEDSGDIVLEPFANDSTDTFLAKRMFMRMLSDLAGEAPKAAPDMFGHIEDGREQRRQEALIWMYDLNPDGADVPFVWVCDEIGIDAELIRRVTGRSVRDDLKRILKLLSSMVSPEYAKACEDKLMDYINLTGWNVN